MQYILEKHLSQHNLTEIPFNRPFADKLEEKYVLEALRSVHLSGDGPFSEFCHQWLETNLETRKALLTPSGTAALEMTALLANIEAGDEVIMPSFTFVSTANAFVLRGATPVFVDICPQTLNIDSTKIEAAITERTRAVVVVHYAGVACDMDPILDICKKYNLIVIEDAAHALLSKYKGRPLGSIGSLAALSFHETKNLICGEGGAMLVNEHGYESRAEIIREKGTNRKAFFQGQVDKYTWLDLGSSYLPSELQAAFLKAQIEQVEYIQSLRLQSWNYYHSKLSRLEREGFLVRPTIPAYSEHNAHLYYILFNSAEERLSCQQFAKSQNIACIPHYIPLHTSQAGLKFGKVSKEGLPVTDTLASKLLRLPLWIGLAEEQQERVCCCLEEFFLLNEKARKVTVSSNELY